MADLPDKIEVHARVHINTAPPELQFKPEVVKVTFIATYEVRNPEAYAELKSRWDQVLELLAPGVKGSVGTVYENVG
ncbi:MAG TPA: hypothetical protein VIW73_13145 [Candidatus Cybelea sp.]